MSATIDVRIKPYTVSSDVQKVANELKNTLTKELDKHGDDKSLTSLNRQVKNTIQSVEQLQKEMAALGNVKYDSKFTDKISKAVEKFRSLTNQVNEMQSAMEEFANTPVGYSAEYNEIVQQATELQLRYSELQQQSQKASEAIEHMYNALASGGQFNEELFQTEIQNLAEYSNEMIEIEKQMDILSVKNDEMQANGTDIVLGKQTEQYQQMQTQLNDITQQRVEQAKVVTDLQQQDADAQEAFAQKIEESQAKLRQEIDKTNDQMKVQVIQYQESGSKLAKAVGVAIPAFNVLGRTIRGTLSLVPTAIGRVTSAVHRLTSIIHLPKISTGIRDILRQLKRSTTMIAGVVLGCRGLYSIINKIRSAFLTGFKDIYNQDKQFKTQIDTIKQKILDIQVAFAEALMPVLQMALPYVKMLLDWVMSLIGVLQRFISTVTGIQAYTKAIKGLGGAAQSANKQLSKLDELNNYSDSGGNGLTPNNSSIGDPDKIENWFEFTRNIIDNIEKMLRAIPWDDVYAKAEKFGAIVGQIVNGIAKPSFWNAVGETIAGVFNTILHFFNTLGGEIRFENIGKSIFQGITGLLDKFDFPLLKRTLITWADGFWTVIKTVLTERSEAGETLAERIVRMLTEALSNINWQTVYAKVQEISTTLAETLNQLIDPGLAHEIGKTLGGTLMSIIKFAIAFLGEGEVDWKELGDTIASGINGFFEEFDGSEMATAINSFLGAIITTIKTVISEVDWNEVWSDIKSIISGVNWKALLTVVVPLIAPQLFAVIWDIVKLVWSLVKKPLLNFLKTTVWPEIVSFFETIFANPIGLVKTVGTFVGNLITSIGSILIATLGGYQIGNGIGEIVALLVGDLDLAEEYESTSIPALIIKMLGLDWDSSRWDEVWADTFDAIGLDKVILWFEDIPNKIREGIGTLQDIGEFLIDGIIVGIMDAMEPDDDVFSDIFFWIVDGICKIFGIHSPAEGTKSIGENIILGIIEGFNLVDFAQKMTEWWNANVLPWFTLEKWTEIVKNIKQSIVDTWNSTKTWWDTNITSWWNEKVAPWFTLEKWESMLSPVKDAFSNIFKGAVNLVIDILNNLIGAIEKLFNNGISGLVGGIGEKFNKLLEPDKQIPTFSNITLPRIPKLATGTVIPPSMSEFIARLGDNNSETEVVSPLSTMKEALLEALQESGGIGGDMTVNVVVDGKVLASAMVKQNSLYKKSTGRSLFA